jgi:hypothetical protein
VSFSNCLKPLMPPSWQQSCEESARQVPPEDPSLPFDPAGVTMLLLLGQREPRGRQRAQATARTERPSWQHHAVIAACQDWAIWRALYKRHVPRTVSLWVKLITIPPTDG